MAGMRKGGSRGLSIKPDEQVLVDMIAPNSNLVFPFLEVVLLTGLAWMGIGWLDNPHNLAQLNTELLDPALLHNSVVAVWMLLVVWRFVLPLLRNRKQRFIVTNQRIVARPAKLTAKVDSIPLHQVLDVARRRKGISLAVRGFSYPLYFGGVPKSKKVVGEIKNALHPSPYF